MNLPPFWHGASHGVTTEGSRFDHHVSALKGRPTFSRHAVTGYTAMSRRLNRRGHLRCLLRNGLQQ